MRLFDQMFGGGGNGAGHSAGVGSSTSSHALDFDLPSLPWSVWIEGKNLIVRDACNEYVGTFSCDPSFRTASFTLLCRVREIETT